MQFDSIEKIVTISLTEEEFMYVAACVGCNCQAAADANGFKVNTTKLYNSFVDVITNKLVKEVKHLM